MHGSHLLEAPSVTTLNSEEALWTLADTWAKRLVRVLVMALIVALEAAWLTAIIGVVVWELFLR